MNFQIAGKRYEVTREDVMDATRDIPPTIPDARHKYFVKLHNRQYPIKQVMRLVTGLDAARVHLPVRSRNSHCAGFRHFRQTTV